MTPSELIYGFISLGLLVLTFVSWLVFRLVSMRRMERAIMAEGQPRPCPWDGIGFRVTLYAAALTGPRWAFSEWDEKPWNLSPGLVQRHSQPLDRVLAWVFMSSLYVFFIVTVLGMLFGLFPEDAR